MQNDGFAGWGGGRMQKRTSLENFILINQTGNVILKISFLHGDANTIKLNFCGCILGPKFSIIRAKTTSNLVF